MLLKRDGYSAPFPLYMIPLYYTLMLFAKSSFASFTYFNALALFAAFSSSVTWRMTFAGLPKARLPSGIWVFCVTKAPAPIMQSFPITAPFKTMAPIANCDRVRVLRVYNYIILNICLISNGNRVGISTDSSMIPHTRIFSQLHITLDNSSFCYILLF